MSTNNSTTPPIIDPLARLYADSQAELDALDNARQLYQDGLLTLNETICTMEGKQLWQLLASQ